MELYIFKPACHATVAISLCKPFHSILLYIIPQYPSGGIKQASNTARSIGQARHLTVQSPNTPPDRLPAGRRKRNINKKKAGKIARGGGVGLSACPSAW